MSLTHTWSNTIKNDSGASVLADPSLILTGDAEVNFAVDVLAGTTTQIVQPVTVAAIVSGFISSDQAVTVKTNSNTTPVQTFSLAAKVALSWNNTLPASSTNPFTTNITQFFVTNAGATTAKVRGGFLLQE